MFLGHSIFCWRNQFIDFIEFDWKNAWHFSVWEYLNEVCCVTQEINLEIIERSEERRSIGTQTEQTMAGHPSSTSHRHSRNNFIAASSVFYGQPNDVILMACPKIFIERIGDKIFKEWSGKNWCLKKVSNGGPLGQQEDASSRMDVRPSLSNTPFQIRPGCYKMKPTRILFLRGYCSDIWNENNEIFNGK